VYKVSTKSGPSWFDGRIVRKRINFDRFDSQLDLQGSQVELGHGEPHSSPAFWLPAISESLLEKHDLDVINAATEDFVHDGAVG